MRDCAGCATPDLRICARASSVPGASERQREKSFSDRVAGHGVAIRLLSALSCASCSEPTAAEQQRSATEGRKQWDKHKGQKERETHTQRSAERGTPNAGTEPALPHALASVSRAVRTIVSCNQQGQRFTIKNSE